MRYVETERYKLERAAGKAMFGLYRNPFSHHPCVRLAVDSTANTNVLIWAGKLLALKGETTIRPQRTRMTESRSRAEVALPYIMDANTLETIGYDPFESEVDCNTFTAHPKHDPIKDELVVFVRRPPATQLA